MSNIFSFVVLQHSQQFCNLLFPDFFLNYLFFSSTFPLSSNKKSIIFFLNIRKIFQRKKMLYYELFKTDFLKLKTKFTLTTKSYVTKYDQMLGFPWLLWFSRKISLSFPSFSRFFYFSRFFLTAVNPVLPFI